VQDFVAGVDELPGYAWAAAAGEGDGPGADDVAGASEAVLLTPEDLLEVRHGQTVHHGGSDDLSGLEFKAE
jgi:hypothetical protein